MKTWTINFYLLLLAIINGHCFTIYAPKFYHDKGLLDLTNTLFKDRYDNMEEPSMIDKRTEETLAHCIQFHCGGIGKGGRGKYLMCLHNSDYLTYVYSNKYSTTSYL
ncbi:unnamed protein product [Owenia fusiformis]|uniref:Uncharacterized protein n=1 Tax=Owenia fusiformis TaxID=6347 RepID=A0A8S4PZS6_OWEFU|nr:unnamed protein product [Owenia fusiformis]